MKVGFIGAGTLTATIGRHLINAGRTIVVSNSRGRETLGNSSRNSVRAPSRGPSNRRQSAKS